MTPEQLQDEVEYLRGTRDFLQELVNYQKSLLVEAREALENDCVPFIGWLPIDPESIKRRVQKTIDKLKAATGGI